MLEQIFNYSKESYKCVYSDDYENDAIIEIDDEGNITYIFSEHYENFLWQTYKNTHYYFEVKDAEYWRSQLDLYVYKPSKIIDNELVNGAKHLLDQIPPDSGLPVNVDFYISMADMGTDVMKWLLTDQIHHNTNKSAYLYDRVIYKPSDVSVPILRTVTTYQSFKYKWQDSFKQEIIFDDTTF